MSISHYPFPLSIFLFSPSIPLATKILVSRGYIDMLVRALVVSPILQIDFRTEQHTQHLSIGKRVCTYMYPPSIYITAALYQLNEVVPSVTDLHTTLLSYSAVLHIGVKLLYFERVVGEIRKNPSWTFAFIFKGRNYSLATMHMSKSSMKV